MKRAPQHDGGGRSVHPAVVAGVIAVAVVALGAAGYGLNRVAGQGTPPAVPTPKPSATPTTAATIPYADCSKATFGAALQPLDAPADVHTYPAAPAMEIDTAKLYRATITTARGVITLCLQPSLAPKTVNSFVALARNHFYDGLTFHRVVAGFVVQGGDPSGNGSGGPGYKFDDEPVRQQYVAGCVAMANSGANTNGSQFFICIADDTKSLQPLYNLFGKVESGLDVATAIQQGDLMQTVTVSEQQ